MRDVASDVWSILDRLIEKDDVVRSSPGASIHIPTQTSLSGWEFMASVKQRDFRRKKRSLEKTHGGWANLVNDTYALILFGTGFGDIIVPMESQEGPCLRWRTLPFGKDYLATRCKMSESLYETTGSRKSRKYLTPTHLPWWRGHEVFERCPVSADPCTCDRLQQLVNDSKSAMGYKSAPCIPPEYGCVFFGRASHRLLPRLNQRPNHQRNDRRDGSSCEVTQINSHSVLPIRSNTRNPPVLDFSSVSSIDQSKSEPNGIEQSERSKNSDYDLIESDVMGGSMLRPLGSTPSLRTPSLTRSYVSTEPRASPI